MHIAYRYTVHLQILALQAGHLAICNRLCVCVCLFLYGCLLWLQRTVELFITTDHGSLLTTDILVSTFSLFSASHLFCLREIGQCSCWLLIVNCQCNFFNAKFYKVSRPVVAVSVFCEQIRRNIGARHATSELRSSPAVQNTLARVFSKLYGQPVHLIFYVNCTASWRRRFQGRAFWSAHLPRRWPTRLPV